MIDKIKTLFKKRYEVYKLDLKTNKQTSLRSFEKDFKAREFVRKILDEKLKLLCYETKGEYTLAQDYFDNREYKYILPNCDFEEDDYIKQKAPNLYHQMISKRVNNAYKKVQNEHEEKILNDIQNCEVIDINSCEDFIEIVYKKDDETKYLTINKKVQISSIIGQYYGFTIDNKKLGKSTKSLFLQDIKKIVKIFHMYDSHPEYHNVFIEILFKDSKNVTSSYRISIDIDEDFNSVDFLFTRYENIFSFKSKILNDEYKTEFNFFYDDEYFYPSIKRNYLSEQLDMKGDLEPIIMRRSYGDYPDYSCITYGKKVFFEIDTDFIKAYNLGFLHNQVIERKYFDMLSLNKKEDFKRFLSIAELYINDLEVNQKFDNEIIFDWEKDEKNYNKLGTLNKNLENSDFKKELIYYNGEQGHPSTKEVYIYTKDDKKLFYFWEIEFYGDYDIVTIKYNDDLKDEVSKLLEK